MWVKQQREICARWESPFVETAMASFVGVAKTAWQFEMPLNGLRHPVAGSNSGWFLWGGSELSEAPDFFEPCHVSHIAEGLPLLMPYLGLAPGWRFLVTPSYEDVWFDEALLAV
ncbi:hypothetical protein [Pacificoceanicola onchidii]|uniref:immunity protein Imm33 domain-containing protein n=1 Tax=Pacificoceanicola onchidii TaxID=2562685 RepID=UPI0010A3C5FF|nr:hypothetical protein [Pacificoceanicola onchidii]